VKALIAAFVLAACQNGSAKPPPPKQQPPAPAAAPDPAQDQGAVTYNRLCSQCHGADAKGYKSDHAPSLINPTFLASATDAFISKSIAFGRPGTAMAGYSKQVGGPLDDAAIMAITRWLRAQGTPPEALPAIGGGDPAKGKQLYAVNCQKCHGDAVTRGEFVHLANPRFLDVATDSFIAYAIVHGRPGTPMEAFGTKLSAAGLASIVAYVRSFATPNAAAVAPNAELPPPTGKEPLFINPTGKPPTGFKLTADPGKPPRYVSVDQVKKALDEKRKMVIIDARPPSDWMRVHITGAVSIPYFDMKRLDEIPKDAWVVAYCACPHHLSGIVADELQKRGYAHALVLDEGILEWHRRGYPVVAAPGVTPPPKEPAMAPGTPR
jgi:mono/diheme cytochrome c family protein/rhodanese-related sulfurtransferase